MKRRQLLFGVTTVVIAVNAADIAQPKSNVHGPPVSAMPFCHDYASLDGCSDRAQQAANLGLPKSNVTVSSLTPTVGSLSAKQIVLEVDCCHDGPEAAGMAYVSVKMPDVVAVDFDLESATTTGLYEGR
jgi:hypothetical protein